MSQGPYAPEGVHLNGQKLLELRCHTTKRAATALNRYGLWIHLCRGLGGQPAAFRALVVQTWQPGDALSLHSAQKLLTPTAKSM